MEHTPQQLCLRERPKNNKTGLNNSRVPEFLKNIYTTRGIESEEEIELKLEHLSNADLLPGCDKALALLTEVREKQERIVIVGDYDADGTVGTVLLYKALSMLGYEQLDYIIPDRFRFGYGLSTMIVEQALQKSPAVLMTVDHGTTSHAGVERAKLAGVKVIITDHHLPSEQLPCADAIVNPHLEGSQFPARALAGVGVAFYLMGALRTHLAGLGYFEATAMPMGQFLDLVAIGTVSDIVPLDKDNRILVAEGVRRIRKKKCLPGILAVLQAAKCDVTQLVASDLGFVVGPRLNAVGRLENTEISIACLLSDNMNDATKYAQKLEHYNSKRKEIEQAICCEALAQVQKQSRHHTGICIMQDNWHEGIVGIVAARLKERFTCPCIVFAPSDETTLRGSARSIVGTHIRDLLVAIDALEPGLMSAFGGHSMAAGLTLPMANFARFKELFEAQLASHQPTQEVLTTDGVLAQERIDINTAQLIQSIPWGKDFPEPLFEGAFHVLEKHILSEQHLKLKLCPQDKIGNFSHKIDAIFFNFFNRDKINPIYCCDFDLIENIVQVVYYLRTNKYSGFSLHLKYIQPIGG